MEEPNHFVSKVISYLKQLAAETDRCCKEIRVFKRYLEIMSRFWNYSYRNQLLIMSQMPQAARVAGFRRWREMRRHVKEGSKAIKILTPRIKKISHVEPH